MSQYFPPQMGANKYHCPHCGVFASQANANVVFGNQIASNFASARCSYCSKYTVWYEPAKAMIFPDTGTAPLPHDDMPAEVVADYNEARSIFNKSPKGAAALLRLGLQKLLKALGEKGDNINDDIGELVRKHNLPATTQQALDAVRIIGNSAVHPGEIKLDDTPEIAFKIFGLLNFIARNQITEPKEIAALYGGMPAGALAAVAKRDATKP